MEKALERDTGEMAAAAGAAADSECVAGGPGGGVEPESRLFSAHIQGRAKTLAVGAVLAAAGGFLDAFTYVGHGRVFANAMTGNVVLLGVDAVSGSWPRSLRHLLPIVMFLLGVAAAKALRLCELRGIVRQPQLAVLGLEIALLGLLGFLPATASDFPITMTIAFAASLQMTTFREVGGRSYSSTFTSGNLRTMIESGFDWIFGGRQPGRLTDTGNFAAICSMFLLGAIAGAWLTPRMVNRALWVDVGLLAYVFLRLLFGARAATEDQ
jgi:uncharacterized membrane protein YoaK (UPF0700 family)